MLHTAAECSAATDMHAAALLCVAVSSPPVNAMEASAGATANTRQAELELTHRQQRAGLGSTSYVRVRVPQAVRAYAVCLGLPGADPDDLPC